MAKARATARSRSEIMQELRNLQAMYKRLPPDKQRTHHPSMQARVDALNAELEAAPPPKADSGRTLSTAQTVVLALLLGLVALGGGFFAVLGLGGGAG